MLRRRNVGTRRRNWTSLQKLSVCSQGIQVRWKVCDSDVQASHTPTVVQGRRVDGTLPWVFALLQYFENILPNRLSPNLCQNLKMRLSDMRTATENGRCSWKTVLVNCSRQTSLGCVCVGGGRASPTLYVRGLNSVRFIQCFCMASCYGK